MRETNKSHLDGAEAGEPELHSLPKPAAVQPRHPALTSVAAWACVRARARMAAINLGPIHCTLLRAMALYLHGSLRHACGGKGFGEPSRGSSGRSGEEGRLFLAIQVLRRLECAHKNCSGNNINNFSGKLGEISLVWAELRLGRNLLIGPNSSLRGPKRRRWSEGTR